MGATKQKDPAAKLEKLAPGASGMTPDAAIRDYVLGLAQGNVEITLPDLRKRILEILELHPGAGRIDVQNGRKRGDREITVYDAEDGKVAIAFVEIKKDGEVEALPTNPPTMRELLEKIPGIGEATAAKVLDEIGISWNAEATTSELNRAAKHRGGAKAGLRGKALAIWIATGENGSQQAARGRYERQMRESAKQGSRRSRKSPKNRGAKDEDIRAAELATETAASKGSALSQRVTPAEAKKGRTILARIHKSGAPWELLGFSSERRLKRFVTGELAMRDLSDDEKDGVRDFTKRIGSHQVWARKAAAIAYGIQEQLKELSSR